MAEPIQPRSVVLGGLATLAVIVPTVVVVDLVTDPGRPRGVDLAVFGLFVVAFVAGGALASRLSGPDTPGARTGAAAGAVAVLALLAYAVIVGTAPPVGGVLVFLAFFAALGALGGALGRPRGRTA